MAVPKKKNKKKIIKKKNFIKFTDCLYCRAKFYDNNVLDRFDIYESFFYGMNYNSCLICNLILTSLDKEIHTDWYQITEFFEHSKMYCYAESVQNRIKYY